MTADGDATGKNADGTEDLEGQSRSDERDTTVNDSADAATGRAEAGSGDADAPGVEQAQTVVELATRIDELTEQLLRKTADFDNYRKRMLREKEEFAAYANRELLLDIVPIIDDFERAIKSAEESRDFDAFFNGVAMIEKQFTSMLERKWKLVRFDSVGTEFDPQRHEAILTEESSEHDVSVVLEDYQKGYLLHEKVLRPSKVKVSVPVAASADGDSGDAPTGEAPTGEAPDERKEE
ncbi:MAG: nucleotide exchange factor GrpE [Spirochaetaceae bacterium]|nr:MAG: nucleotide exchange factor GrpE [Spirochaetaceae bacterium]